MLLINQHTNTHFNHNYRHNNTNTFKVHKTSEITIIMLINTYNTTYLVTVVFLLYPIHVYIKYSPKGESQSRPLQGTNGVDVYDS